MSAAFDFDLDFDFSPIINTCHSESITCHSEQAEATATAPSRNLLFAALTPHVWSGHSCPLPLTLIFDFDPRTPGRNEFQELRKKLAFALCFWVAQRFTAAHRRANSRNAASDDDVCFLPTRLCLPERRTWIRLMNPHAQSKDPYPSVRE